MPPGGVSSSRSAARTGTGPRAADRVPAVRSRRRLVPALTVVLSLATGIALLGLAQLFTTSPAPTTDDRIAASANGATVRALYAAANQMLETGDPSELEPLMAPDLMEHRSSASTVANQAGLIQTLVSLHTGFPTIRLMVDDLVAHADEVVARVHLTGVAPGQILGLSLPAALAVWGGIDVFRLAHGMIVEHWGGRDSAVQLRPLQRTTVVLPYPRTVITARRLTFVPAEVYDADALYSPTLLAVEAGQLVVTIKPAAVAQPAPAVLTRAARGTPGAGEPVTLGHAVTLRAGDLLVLPEGLTFSAMSGGGAPAVCLALALQLAAPFVATEIHGPAVQRLADNLPGPLPSGTVAVALGQVTLAPGVTPPLTTTTGPTLVAVEAGKLDMTMATGGTWIQRGGDGSSLAIGRVNAQVAFPPATTLATRDAAVVGAARRGWTTIPVRPRSRSSWCRSPPAMS